MATFDWTQIAKDAEEMINLFGRDITFVKFAVAAADPAKPWRGNLTPRESPDDSVTLKGVFVPPSSATKLGLSTFKPGMTDTFKQLLMIAPGATLATTDFESFDEIIDDSVRWKITKSETLKPGTTRLMYFFEVER
jgi:hypothetical protein